ncbi:MAG: M48 family metalloprotease [Betaproteobacteria bacterium]|jgi:predicted Zn-dependent protease
MLVIRVLILLVVASATSVAVAIDLPELGDTSSATISPAQERALGLDIMRQIRAAPAYLDDPEVKDYLDNLGYRLVAASPDSRLGFSFFALMDNSVNAFALPGGFIGVHSALLLTSRSESELAAVLAHEVAHVTQKHIARMISAQQKQGLASLAAMAIAILASRSNPQAAAGAIAATQAQALSDRLAFTRDNEREADRVGVGILERAGFDPHAMPVFLERLQKATRVLETGAPSYMRTHPITYERVADVQNRTFDLPFRQIPDSLDFHLVRARVRALQKDAREAVAFFDDLIADRKFSNEVAARYGLVESLLRAKNPERAAVEARRLKTFPDRHPILISQEARVLIAGRRPDQALQVYAKGLTEFPTRRSLVYEYAQLLVDSGRAMEANGVIERRMQADPDDGRLYEIQAKAYAALGNTMLKHRSLAEAYLAAGQLIMAMDQLQLALRNSNGNFYDVSSVEARLRELRAIPLR